MTDRIRSICIVTDIATPVDQMMHVGWIPGPWDSDAADRAYGDED